MQVGYAPRKTLVGRFIIIKYVYSNKITVGKLLAIFHFSFLGLSTVS
jgi:hypothetical protein